MSTKTFETITNRIIQLLEQGTIPWKKTWSEGAGLGEHQNLISQHGYKGINALLTAAAGFSSPYWLTFKQASELGATVRKGEKGTPIVFWKFGTEQKEDGKEKSWAYAMHSTVFNIEQIDGLDTVKVLAAKRKAKRIDFNPIESCEKIVSGFKNAPSLKHVEQRAFYRPSTDSINMPKQESFSSVEAYYATLFHEMTHSTGHKSRLGREGITEKNYFGSHSYSKEELVAEMGAAFLCGRAGISTATEENSAAYIKGWLEVFKGDSSFLIKAASQAQKAASLILGESEETEEKK